MAQTFIPIPIVSVAEAKEAPSLTYALDLKQGRIVGKVDGRAAVKQAILKALITPRHKCLIYNNQYGSEIEDAIINKDATQEYTASAMEGFIKDALKPDTRILRVRDVKIQFNGDETYVKFTAETIFGDEVIEEVFENV